MYGQTCLFKWKSSSFCQGPNFEIEVASKKKWESILIFRLFYKKVCQSQQSLFLNNPPLSATSPFLEFFFHQHSYCQIRESQFPFVKVRRDLNHATAIRSALVLLLSEFE